jgi:hypothetical protein
MRAAMTRVVFNFMSVAFRTLLICCAVYVYMEAANPALARRAQAIPYVNMPVFDLIGREWDRLVEYAGVPRDWSPAWASAR